MEKIGIQTSQHVIIEQSVASIGERIVAQLLDFIFYFGYAIIVMFITSIIGRPTGIYVLFVLPVLFYHLICEWAMEGQSWGKKITGIKVVKRDGTQLTFISCLLRWIFRLVDVLILFGGIATLVIIINGKGQRLGDMAANTMVIRLKKNHLKDTLLTELPGNYEVKFPEASNLSSSDIYTIKEVLDYCKKYYFIGRAAEMAFAAKSSFEKKLMIKSDLVPGIFLETLVNDYNALHRI